MKNTGTSDRAAQGGFTRAQRFPHGVLEPFPTWRGLACDPTSGLNAYERLLVCVLDGHMTDTQQVAWPGVARLASYTSLSVRSVQRALRGLEDKGWLVVKLGTGRRTSVYRPVAPKGAKLSTSEIEG